ncbi:Dyp-type peroxidase [Jatrophihabitans sp. DSM 45814]
MTESESQVGRRRFLSSAGLLAGGAAAGVAVGAVGGAVGKTAIDRHDDQSGPAVPAVSTIAFEGTHQAGVVDRQPAYFRFLALDLVSGNATAAGRASLRAALLHLSSTARSAMAGRPSGPSADIAAGLRPAQLSVTIGIGASALVRAGLSVPEQLRALPTFSTDHLDPAHCGGDLGVQICGEDPMVVAATARSLVTGSLGGLSVRWSQGGFLRSAAAAVQPTATPRNLMGQLDGTDNPTGTRQTLAVWVPEAGSPPWMRNGTYLVCRRIRMLLDEWDRTSVNSQERVIGRFKDSGAPLSGHLEHDVPQFTATQSDGSLTIPADAHVRLTHPANNSAATMFRRGYSFDDGIDASGQLDAGLFFQAFQTDPQQTFVPIQHKLARSDALNSFIRHEGSAVFAIPPGASPGGFVGEGLF